MLIRLLDTSGIDMNDPEIQSELRMDLRRMDRLNHEEMPEGVKDYKVIVTPSTRTFGPGLHRFRFEILYGNVVEDKFEPMGEPVLYQTETLPMI